MRERVRPNTNVCALTPAASTPLTPYGIRIYRRNWSFVGTLGTLGPIPSVDTYSVWSKLALCLQSVSTIVFITLRR
jgi:hypothetical protein